MGLSKTLYCPLCGGNEIEPLMDLNTPELVSRYLPDSISIRQCKWCTHIFNELSEEDYNQIALSYKSEYDLKSIVSENSELDKPGSWNPYSVLRYEETAEFILSYGEKNSSILDIGCAQGGFLAFLESKGFSSLYGVDVSSNFLDIAKDKVTSASFRLGSVESIPYPSNYFDAVVIDQVLEHVRNPLNAIDEILRVLKRNGKIVVGVPNSSKYSNSSLFPYYWFLLKEHLHHFNIKTLNLFFTRRQLRLLNYKEVATLLLGEDVFLPNLIAVFDTAVTNSGNESEKSVSEESLNVGYYLANEERKWNGIVNKIDSLVQSGKPTFCWGISRELQYLLANSPLRQVNVKKVLDSNPQKLRQGILPFDDVMTSLPYEFGEETINVSLLITAVGYSRAISERAQNLGFRGEIICLNDVYD